MYHIYPKYFDLILKQNVIPIQVCTKCKNFADKKKKKQKKKQ